MKEKNGFSFVTCCIVLPPLLARPFADFISACKCTAFRNASGNVALKCPPWKHSPLLARIYEEPWEPVSSICSWKDFFLENPRCLGLISVPLAPSKEPAPTRAPKKPPNTTPMWESNFVWEKRLKEVRELQMKCGGAKV